MATNPNQPERPKTMATTTVTSDTLNDGTWQQRKAAWGIVLANANTMPEEELNDWWRGVMADAAWVTPKRLAREAANKIADCDEFKIDF
jgi:hypothetical protein